MANELPLSGLTEDQLEKLTANQREILGLPPVPKSFAARLVEGSDFLSSRRFLRTLFGLDKSTSAEPEPFDVDHLWQGRTLSWYEQQLSYENSRLASYRMVQEMSQFGMISTCLSLFSEDATQYDTEHGRSAWIESPNNDIKRMLTEMLDRCQIEDRIYSFAYTTAIFGDNFENIVYSREDGVLGLRFVHPAYVTRIEDNRNVLQGFVPELIEEDDLRKLPMPDLRKKFEGRFAEPWDFLHFRLQGGRRTGSHGMSLIIDARRTWRIIKMLQDAVVLYRLNRAPTRLVFKIDTGNQNAEEQKRTLNTWRSFYRKRTYLSTSTGVFRSEINPLCFTGDTEIRLLNGEILSLKEIHQRFGFDKSFWVYSVDSTGRIVPGEARSLGVTGRSAKLVEVELDSGEKVRCTPTHKWMLRDGTYCEAKDLVVGSSLMPLYTAKYCSPKKTNCTYEMVYDPASSRYRRTHRLVAERCHGPIPSGHVVHHLDLNSRNNAPDNLCIMSAASHRELHREVTRARWKDPAMRARAADAMRSRWKADDGTERSRMRNLAKQINEEFREFHSEQCKKNNATPEVQRVRLAALRLATAKRFSDVAERARIGKILGAVTKAGWADPESRAKRIAAMRAGWAERRAVKNHRVASVRHLSVREDVYDIHVLKYHNFCLGAGVCVKNSVDEDLFMSVSKDKATDITKLDGVSNTGDIADLEHFTTMLAGDLGVPKAFLTGDASDLNARATLVTLDVRYARRVKRLQRALIYGITQLCRIHLALTGKDPLDRKNSFEVRMAPISQLDELQRIETYTNRVNLAQNMLGIANAEFDQKHWARFVLRDFVKLTDAQIADFIPYISPTGAAQGPGGDMGGMPPDAMGGPPGGDADLGPEPGGPAIPRDVALNREPAGGLEGGDDLAAEPTDAEQTITTSQGNGTHRPLLVERSEKVYLTEKDGKLPPVGKEQVFDLDAERTAYEDEVRAKRNEELLGTCHACGSKDVRVLLKEDKNKKFLVCGSCPFVAELED